MNVTHDILIQFRAAFPVVPLDCPSAEEPNMIERVLRSVCLQLKLPLITWNLGQGFRQVLLEGDNGIVSSPIDLGWKGRISQVFEVIDQYANDAVFILCDIHPFLAGQTQDLTCVRLLKNLCFSLKQSRKRVILLGEDLTLPADFTGLVYALHYKLPGYNELEALSEYVIDDLKYAYHRQAQVLEIQLSKEDWPRLVRACQGLTRTEASDAIRLAVIAEGVVSSEMLERITALKIQKLKRYNVDFAPPPDVAIGGLDLLKEWVRQRTQLFTLQATRPDLPTPKGIMLVGAPGCGKTLCAKTIAHQWGMPTLQFDISSALDSLVGQSESNVRHILRTAEAIAPCVLVIDEVDKALGGVGGASTDGGVSQRIFGTILTWMQEKKAPVFIVMTANRLNGLPPELTRKGRLDEVFFVDLPNASERREILDLHLSRRHCLADNVQLDFLVELSQDFSGAEIAGAVDAACISALATDESLNYGHVGAALQSETPLSVRDSERITALRDEVRLCRRASTPEVVNAGKSKVGLMI